jgi:hypothetical protein
MKVVKAREERAFKRFSNYSDDQSYGELMGLSFKDLTLVESHTVIHRSFWYCMHRLGARVLWEDET